MIALGVAAVVSIVVVGVLLVRKQPVVVAAAPPVPGALPGAPAAGTPGAPTPGAAAAAPGAPTAAAPGAPTAAAPTEHADRPRKGGGAKTAAKAAAAPAPGPKLARNDPSPASDPPAAPARKSKKGGDDLDALLNGASPEKESPKPRAVEREERAASNDADLPDQLDKGQIVGGMGKVKGRVAACYEQFKVPGLANVAVTIGKSGKVQNAAVSGAFAGTPTGECVSKAVRSASFPPFKGAAQTINYPFMLR